MPEPEPNQPPPRPVPFWKWLLLLLPSVIAIAAPLITDAWMRAVHIHGEGALGTQISIMLLSLALAAVLCFVLGFLLEKWLVGNLRNWLRPLGYGCLILIVNGFIAFAGCTTLLR